MTLIMPREKKLDKGWGDDYVSHVLNNAFSEGERVVERCVSFPIPFPRRSNCARNSYNRRDVLSRDACDCSRRLSRWRAHVGRDA